MSELQIKLFIIAEDGFREFEFTSYKALKEWAERETFVFALGQINRARSEPIAYHPKFTPMFGGRTQELEPPAATESEEQREETDGWEDIERSTVQMPTRQDDLLAMNVSKATAKLLKILKEKHEGQLEKWLGGGRGELILRDLDGRDLKLTLDHVEGEAEPVDEERAWHEAAQGDDELKEIIQSHRSSLPKAEWLTQAHDDDLDFEAVNTSSGFYDERKVKRWLEWGEMYPALPRISFKTDNVHPTWPTLAKYWAKTLNIQVEEIAYFFDVKWCDWETVESDYKHFIHWLNHCPTEVHRRYIEKNGDAWQWITANAILNG